MKQLVVRVMLICIASFAPVYADPLGAGLGADRSALSSEQIAARSRRFEESTTFSLLRYPEALRAPARILSPGTWGFIEAAARAHNLDPMVLAGMIFVESYGDPLAKSPTGPAGIAQLTRASAKELGLATGRKVRIGTKAVKKTRWVGKGTSRRKVVQTVQQPVYKTIDERYVPERAIKAMARRLGSRRAWLGGKTEFAIAEYHMGAGRMARLLSAYFGRTIRVSDVPAEMAGATVSYPELYWTNTPYFRPAVYQALEDLTRVDYSPTYYFRVRQAMRLLEMYRKSPAEYESVASGFQNRFGYAVLPSWQWSFVDAATVAARNVEDRFVLLPPIATAFGLQARISDMSAERSTVGSALFVAHQLNRLQGTRYTGFQISRMLAHGDDAEEDEALPLHGMGWAFDVPSSSLSKADLRDLKFILTDLRQAGLLAYVEDDGKHGLSRRPAPRSRRWVRAVLLGRHGRTRAPGWTARGAAHSSNPDRIFGPRHPDRNFRSGRHGRSLSRPCAPRSRSPIQPSRRCCCCSSFSRPRRRQVFALRCSCRPWQCSR